MKYKNENGEWKDIYVKASDTLPIGAEVDYDGDDIPAGWEEVVSKNILQVSLTNDYTFSTKDTFETIPLQTKDFQLGSNLKMSDNGGIKIGKGINTVKVIATLSQVKTAAGLMYVRINKNNVAIGTDNVYAGANQRTKAGFVAYIDVEEGDIITLQAMGATTDKITHDRAFTTLIVESINTVGGSDIV